MRKVFSHKIKSYNHFVLFFVLTLFSSCSKNVKKADLEKEEILNPDYEQYINNATAYLENIDFQGSVLVGKKDEIIFAKGFGTSNRKDKAKNQNTIQTTFETGSISKQLTAAAIIQLYKGKKLNLNDKISKYFPDYNHGNEITIKMLLNMRSGITDHINAAEDFFPKSVYKTIQKNEINNLPLEEDIVLKNLNHSSLIAKPDSTYFYCNTNYYLLAKIIEKVSGLTYEEYLQKNIFDPCKMTKSNVKFQHTDSKGYDYKNRYYSIPSSLALGCGDLNSNVVDLFKWNNALMENKVIPKKFLKGMINEEGGYGFGLYSRNDLTFHGGITNVFNAYNSYSKNDKISVIVLVNRPIGDCNATVVAANLRKLLEEN